MERRTPVSPPGPSVRRKGSARIPSRPTRRGAAENKVSSFPVSLLRAGRIARKLVLKTWISGDILATEADKHQLQVGVLTDRDREGAVETGSGQRGGQHGDDR